MILKFIYGKQIHLYDLKQAESFQHACERIRVMFKRLPEQFILTYRNSEQLELEIDSNQQLDQLIHDLKPYAKMVKLYITDITERKLNSNLLQADNNMSQQNDSKSYAQNLQGESSNTKQLQQESVPFTDLHESHEIEAQNPIDSQYQRIQSSDRKEFQRLDSSDEQENEVQRQVKNYLRDKMQNICFNENGERQLDTNEQEKSDPQEMQNLGQGKQLQKETFYSQLLEEKPEVVVTQTEPIKLQQQVNEMVDEFAVEKLPFSQRKRIFQPYEPKPNSQQHDNMRHHRAKCDMCQVAPIIGVRYKCVICPDYDICEKCEQHNSHQHPLLKIRFTHQTPISIKVQIPQLSGSQKTKQQPQIVLQRFDITQLDVEQRKQRMTTMASELSELLDIDFHQCFQFIRQNEHYTKESLTQLMISRKEGKHLRRERTIQGKKEQKTSGINGILSNFKGLFSSFISN